MRTSIRFTMLSLFVALFAWGCSDSSNPVSAPDAVEPISSKGGAAIADTDPSNSGSDMMGMDVIDADALVGAWVLRGLSLDNKEYNRAVGLLQMSGDGSGSFWTLADRGWDRADFVWMVERNTVIIEQATGNRARVVAMLDGNALTLTTGSMMNVDPSTPDMPNPVEFEQGPAWDTAMFQRVNTGVADDERPVDSVLPADLVGDWQVRLAWQFNDAIEVQRTQISFGNDAAMKVRWINRDGRPSTTQGSWAVQEDRLIVRNVEGDVSAVRVISIGESVFLMSASTQDDPTGWGATDETFIPGTKWHIAQLVPASER